MPGIPSRRPIRWVYDRLREVFAPRQEPRTAPAVGVFDPPFRCLIVNEEWISHVIGVVDALAELDAWAGTDAQQFAARQEVEKLLAAFAKGNCDDMAITDIRVNGCSLEVEYDHSGTWTAVGSLDDCPAREIELQSIAVTEPCDGHLIQWRYTGDSTWQNLATVCDGDEGPAGPQGPAGADGADGREIELQSVAVSEPCDGHLIQWRHVGDSTWQNLATLCHGIDGEDGASVELRYFDKGGGDWWVQWRQDDDAPTWADLFEVPAGGVQGPPGASVEMRVDGGWVQWRQDDDDPTWADLFEVPADGAQGPAGASIELREESGWVQWRQDDDAPTWANLYQVPTCDCGPTFNIDFPTPPPDPGEDECCILADAVSQKLDDWLQDVADVLALGGSVVAIASALLGIAIEVASLGTGTAIAVAVWALAWELFGMTASQFLGLVSTTDKNLFRQLVYCNCVNGKWHEISQAHLIDEIEINWGPSLVVMLILKVFALTHGGVFGLMPAEYYVTSADCTGVTCPPFPCTDLVPVSGDHSPDQFVKQMDADWTYLVGWEQNPAGVYSAQWETGDGSYVEIDEIEMYRGGPITGGSYQDYTHGPLVYSDLSTLLSKCVSGFSAAAAYPFALRFKQLCTCGGTWYQTFDFALSDGGWTAVGVATYYSAGEGWRADNPQCHSGQGALSIRWDFGALGPVNIQSVEITAYATTAVDNGARGLYINELGQGDFEHQRDGTVSGQVTYYIYPNYPVYDMSINHDIGTCDHYGYIMSVTIVGTGPNPFI